LLLITIHQPKKKDGNDSDCMPSNSHRELCGGGSEAAVAGQDGAGGQLRYLAELPRPLRTETGQEADPAPQCDRQAQDIDLVDQVVLVFICFCI
jgi:hypothetical protein